MNKRRVWPAALLLVVPLLTLGVPTAALAQNGQINGTVQFASGDPVPGAPVVATARDTGVSSTARSGEAGGFTISDLPAGSYDVRVTHLAWSPGPPMSGLRRAARPRWNWSCSRSA